MTQVDRVLSALRTVGSTGLTQADFYGPTIDGGPPIARVAARVQDLRDRGFNVRTAGVRHKLAVYVLDRPRTPEDHVRRMERDNPELPGFNDEFRLTHQRPSSIYYREDD